MHPIKIDNKKGQVKIRECPISLLILFYLIYITPCWIEFIIFTLTTTIAVIVMWQIQSYLPLLTLSHYRSITQPERKEEARRAI